MARLLDDDDSGTDARVWTAGCRPPAAPVRRVPVHRAGHAGRRLIAAPLALLLLGSAVLCSNATAAVRCVGDAGELYAALLASSLDGAADVIRLEVGTYRAGQPEGFTANLAGGALEISGGWVSGCLFRQRGGRSTIDGEYLRPGLSITGALPHSLTVRVAHLTIRRGVGHETGGLIVAGTGASTLRVELEDNRFHDNTQTAIEDEIGGGVRVAADEVRVFGNVFTENHAGNLAGAGAFTCFGALGAFTNNTIVRNTARFGEPDARGGVMLGGNCLWEVANNILWDNEGYDLAISDGDATLRHNNVADLSGTPAGSSGNVSVEPGFAGTGNLRLRRDSPLVDAGFDDTLLGLPLRSHDGGPRIAGPAIDIGAYELDVLFADDFDPLVLLP